MTTYFQYSESLYRQKHGCATGSPMSPIVANLYMEEVESRALITFTWTAPSHWFRYVDDTWVKIRAREVEAFPEHIDAVDNNKFTREHVSVDSLPFLDCAAYTEEERSLNIGVYRKPSQTYQYLLFDSLHPLEYELGVIRTLNYQAETVPSNSEGREKEQKHISWERKTWC